MVTVPTPQSTAYPTGQLHISFPISMREFPPMRDCRSDAQSVSSHTAAEVIRCIFRRLPPCLQDLTLDVWGFRNMTDEAVSVSVKT
eukprot:1603004-Amphidinium_carterae.2